MAVETTATSASFTGTGVSSTYAPGFYVNSSDQVVVTVDGVVQTLGDDYVVNNVGASTGCDIVGTFTLGAAIYVERVTPITQLVDTQNNETILEDVLDAEFDKLTMIAQELGGKVARALLFPKGEAGYTLPAAAARANQFPVFDANGDLILSSGTGADAGLRADLAASSGAGLVSWIRAATGAVARTIADWFSDQPSVMDYIPAVERVKIRLRTSTADLSSYFLAASAAGKAFVVPEGSYRLAQTVGFAQRVTFMPGARVYRDGGNLAFSGGIAAPIAEQIFYGYIYPQIDVNNDLTPEGWVDWFGYDQDAIETCHKIFKVNRFAARDYFASRTVILDRSYREVIGFYGSAEGAGGTRIVMIGAAAANQPIIQVGTLNTAAVLSCARRLNIRGINTIRAGDPYQPVASGRREDAIPGWKIAGWYEGRMDDCFDYGSAIHYRVYGTIGCTLNRCGGVRPGAGAANGNPDYYTAFVVGGYATSFGFIGANASVTIENCGTAGGVGTARMGLFLFGYIGDTWIKKFEMSQLEYGVFVDGADAGGTALTSLSAHQDVRIRECVLDANLFNCITVQKINRGGAISLDDNYCALNAAGDAVLINSSLGLVSINSGDIIANSGLANYGVRIAGSKRVTVAPAVKIKDCRVGLKAESSGQLRLQPNITRANTGGTNALEFFGTGRSYVAPIIDADVAAFDYAINVDTGANYSGFDISAVNYGCLTTVAAARKIWYNGAGWGGTNAFGNNNVVMGVLT